MTDSIWPTTALGKEVKFLSGGTPSKSESAYWGGNIPWIGSGEMKAERIEATALQVTERGALNGTKLVEPGTVLVVVRGMSLANEFRVSRPVVPATFNQDVKALISKGKFRNDFLYYYLKAQSNAIRDSASEAAHGTKKLDMPVLEQWPLPVIEEPEQEKIAAVLTAYDDLIENNRQRIALLEKMAEEIYREWFVRLRFPGHEHTPVHKGVPEGWAIKLGDDLFETVKGRSYSSEDISDSPTGHDAEHPFITLKSINRGGGYRREGLKYYRGRFNANQIVAPGDVVMAVTDMTQNRAIVGQAARVPNLAECVDAIISLDLVCLRPREWSETFLYSFCRYSGFASHLAQFANGANVLHLKPSVIGSQRLLAPPARLSQQFDSIVEPIHQLADSLSEQSGELTNTRDLLLNRLISGKLRVDDLNIQFPPSMKAEAA